jgi:hypothetical protein
MKLQRHLVVLGLATGAAMAQTTQNYPDATGEVAVGNFPHLDIASVDVTLDEAETQVTFRINLAGDPVATNWGKYMIGIRSNPGGATTGNGWGRPIHMAGGMTHWIGAWVDDGGSPTNSGGQVWSHGTGWATTDAAAVSRDATGVTIVTTPAALGLSPGETFSFDIYTSGGGGGDSAVDALSAAASSIGGWGGPFTTGAVGAETHPAKTFTMPGTADFGTWIAGFSLTGDEALPGTDHDLDGLTNQQEFDLDIGLDPTVDDSDLDGLKDGEETLTGIFVDATDTGTNPMVQDTDGDSVPDGDEAKGEGPSGHVQNPNHFNHAKMVVPGSFNLPGAWDADGFSDPSNEMTRAGTGLTEQYQWSLDHRFAVPKVQVAHKFAAGAWTRNWGAGGTAGVAVASGGDINRTIAASGIHRFTFDTVTLAHTFTRPTFADEAAFLAAYGLAAGGDEDGDGIDNEAEFAANTDPNNPDTDGDGLNDEVDPEPLVAAPESREVVFQVNMTVASSSGYFTPGASTVRVVGQFAGWSTTGGVVLADPDGDGIYTGTYQAAGFEGVAFGTYKFFIDGGPDGGYEQGADRNFNLGPDGAQQVLPVTYYSNTGPPTGFDLWIAGFEGLSDITRGGDPDGDGATNGDEFLFGTSPASGAERPVTATRTGAGLLLAWLERESGATYVLQENPYLAGDWETSAIVPAAAADQDGVPADYDRMEALLPIGAGSNFIRVNASEN